MWDDDETNTKYTYNKPPTRASNCTILVQIQEQKHMGMFSVAFSFSFS